MLWQNQLFIPLISFKTILATKIGDTILKDEDGSLIYVEQDSFYPRGMYGYWLLFYRDYKWYIDSVLVSEQN